MDQDSNKMLMDISERLARVETKIDASSDTRDIANRALSSTTDNTRRLDKIDKIIFWVGTTVIGAVILTLMAIAFSGGAK